MSATQVSYEVFEEDKLSYFPSYIMSAFVLAGVGGLAYYRVPFWPLTLGHLFLIVWFGIAFVWMLRNAQERRRFHSNRLTVTNDTFKHTFRYAVTETTFFEMPLAGIQEVRISAAEPRYVEVIGKSEDDLYFRPRNADHEQLIAALRRGNPDIRVTVV